MIDKRSFLYLCLLAVSAMALVENYKLNTEYDIPMIGLGTYLILGDNTNKIINEALTAGYRLFDSAHVYNNEEDLGRVFKELLPKHNITREDIFITTKIILSTDYKTEADYEKLVQLSLKRLQTSYIDLFLIHWPGVTGLPITSPDSREYRHKAYESLTNFKSRGLIRSVGVSNFEIKHLEALKSAGFPTPALNQVEWHPHYYNSDLLKYCKDNKILLQAYSSLGSSKNTTLREDEKVVKIAKELGKSPSQVLLKWPIQNGVAIIPKATSKKHLEENINLDFEINEEQMKILNSFEQRDKIFGNSKDVPA